MKPGTSVVIVQRLGFHALDTDVSAQPEKGEQEPTLQGGLVHERALGSAPEPLGKVHPQIRLLEHVQQGSPLPAPINFALQDG